MLKEYVLHRSILGEGWAEYSSNNTENHCFFCLKKRLYAVKSVSSPFSVYCLEKLHWHLCILWHYTWAHFEIKLNDCLEWDMLSLCCGVRPLIVIYRDGYETFEGGKGEVSDVYWFYFFLSILMEMLKVAGLINCCLIDPVRLVSALCSSLDNYSDLSSKLRHYLQWNNCTWLWMSFFTS